MSLGIEVFVILNVLNIPLHLIGDFLLQTNAQAQNKSNSDRHCAGHTITYGSVYLFPLVVVLGWGGALAAAVIAIAHYAIDRYSLARLVPMLRHDAAVPYWVEKVADAALHINCNMAVFLVAAWAIA
jgi:hypothetical protein